MADHSRTPRKVVQYVRYRTLGGICLDRPLDSLHQPLALIDIHVGLHALEFRRFPQRGIEMFTPLDE